MPTARLQLDAFAQAKNVMQLNPNPFNVRHPKRDRHTRAELSLTFLNPSTHRRAPVTSAFFLTQKQGTLGSSA
jgi:hypothetical protein